MKYAIVIPDGCADEPQDALGGRTPLQAAHLPNMDRLAQLGVVGRTNNVPPSLTPASDVATLSLFGYDPVEVYTGRSPLEAVRLLIPHADGARLAELYGLGAPIEERVDLPEGVLLVARLPAVHLPRFAPYVVAEAAARAARARG